MKFAHTHTRAHPSPGYITTDAQVSYSVALRIQQARQAKGWTQKELATRICEKPQVVNDYEAGRAIPNQQILAKMERELGVKVRGK